MPRTRLTAEVPQKQSPRGPPQLRTSSSPSEPPLSHRPRTERSPKLAEGRSPRGAQSDPVNKKKLGTRIADLESQLGQAQDELKCLKDQLVSAEAAKKVAQEQLEKKSKKQQTVTEPVPVQEKHFISVKTGESDSGGASFEACEDVENETDVFEVPTETKTKVEPTDDKPKNDEINLLKLKLDEKEKALEVFRRENSSLKNELKEKSLSLSLAQSEMEELSLKMNRADQEMERIKTSSFQINEKLEAAEKAKEELESEMKRLRVQTEQWRKAADAAASVLAGGVETNTNTNGRKISERCGSMDKHYYGSTMDRLGGYAGSPGLLDQDQDDVFGSGKRKGSGIKMFGELWKKKGQK